MMLLLILSIIGPILALYECDDGKEIITDVNLRCNGNIDCDDGSDEEFCLQCSLDQFECLVKGTNQCVSESLRCDGFETCDNGEDEFGCPGQCNGPLNYLCPETNCCISAASVCKTENYCDCEHIVSDYDYGAYEGQTVRKESTDTICSRWSLKEYQAQFIKTDSSQSQVLFSLFLITASVFI